MRRPLMLIPLVAGLAVGSLAPQAAAQEATPASMASRFADTMDLPEIEITLTDDGFQGVPEETEAGRYLVTFTSDTELEGAVDFVRLPEGRTPDDLAAALEGEDEPTEEEMMAAEADLAWAYDAYIAGGVGVGPGGSGQAIVDLLPGDYGIWADDPTSSVPPVAISVTGEMPADLPEPKADAVITEVGTAEGYAFELDGELAPGPRTIRIDIKSDQPHFVVVIGSPEPVTMAQVEALLMFDPESGEAPSPDMLDRETLTFPFYAATQSAGSTQWVAFDVQPQTYILACFVPDPNNEGIPHALEGMVEVVEVGGA